MSRNCSHPREYLVATTDILLRKCVECDDKIFGVRTCYKCNCGSYVHQVCVPPPDQLQTTRHSFYPGVNFNFSRGQPPPGEKQKCVACCQQIKGCHYAGGNNTSSVIIYMHPFCFVNLNASTASSSTTNQHKEALGRFLETHDSNGGRVTKTLTLACQQSLSDHERCIGCKSTNQVAFGFAYRYTYDEGAGTTKTFECHVACLRKKLTDDCWKQISRNQPGETFDRETYFLKLGKTAWENTITTRVAGLTLPVAVAGLDLMISAFVGVPVVSLLLSASLEIAAAQVESGLHGQRRRR